jgi:hypothetical protein
MTSPISTKSAATGRAQVTQFRQHFQRSLKGCLQRGFSAEECFGIVWEETCEQFRLADEAHQQIYEEMLTWAKQWVK